LPTRKTFFNDLRALTRYLVFDSWDHLLTFLIQGLELDLPLNTSWISIMRIAGLIDSQIAPGSK
jgi:hypothetical protein